MSSSVTIKLCEKFGYLETIGPWDRVEAVFRTPSGYFGASAMREIADELDRRNRHLGVEVQPPLLDSLIRLDLVFVSPSVVPQGNLQHPILTLDGRTVDEITTSTKAVGIDRTMVFGFQSIPDYINEQLYPQGFFKRRSDEVGIIQALNEIENFDIQCLENVVSAERLLSTVTLAVDYCPSADTKKFPGFLKLRGFFDWRVGRVVGSVLHHS